VARELVGNEGIPLARSELACIEVRRPHLGEAEPRLRGGVLRWVLTPDDRGKTLAELRGKIKSKMDVAKILGGLLTAALTFLLGSLIDPSKLRLGSPADPVKSAPEQLDDPYFRLCLYVAMAFFFTSALLYIATVYAYDRLLMPSRFWADKPGDPKRRPRWLVWRPPSSATWILYQNMIRVWRHLFVPATFAVIIGLGCLALAVVDAARRRSALGVVLVLGGALFLYYRHYYPRLGTED
jgi:hypothetical protein